MREDVPSDLNKRREQAVVTEWVIGARDNREGASLASVQRADCEAPEALSDCTLIFRKMDIWYDIDALLGSGSYGRASFSRNMVAHPNLLTLQFCNLHREGLPSKDYERSARS